MAPDLDLTNDYLVFDATESVTVRRVTAGPTTSNAGIISETLIDTAVANALRERIETREIEISGGKLRAGDVAWNIPIAQLAAQPKAGDRIVAGTETWIVLRVDEVALRTAWRVIARLEG